MYLSMFLQVLRDLHEQTHENEIRVRRNKTNTAKRNKLDIIKH